MAHPQKQTLPEHAASRRARRLVIGGYVILASGVVFLVLGLLGGGAWMVPFGAVYAAFGVLYVRFARRRTRSLSAFVVLQQAGAAIEDGDLARAERLLAAVPADVSAQMGRAAAIVGAQLALRKGELDESARLLDQVLGSRAALLDEGAHAMQMGLAHASRALVAAALGDERRAREEAKIVEGEPMALPQARARAVLAEAVVLEKRGALADLEALLEKHRPLLQRATDASERLLVRTLWRRLQLPKQAVYRKQASAIESATSRFLTALSPVLASLAEDDLRPMHASTSEHARATTPAPPKSAPFLSRRRALLFGFLFLFAVVFLAVPFSGGGGGAGESRGYPGGPVTIFAVAAAGLLAWTVRQVVRGRRDARRLVPAMAALGEGRLDEVVERAGPIAKTGTMAAVAQAELLLASVAMERGDPEGALEHARRGRETLTWETVREALADTTLANLITTEAYALAALGRAEESSALLVTLPSNATERRQRFCVQQMSAVTSGDDAALADLIDRAPALLPLYDELIRDLARATLRGVSLAEHRRISAEIARPEQRRFLERFAPELLERFQRGDEPARSDSWDSDTGAEASGEASAEVELEADAEAARSERRRA